jgi:ectoine hydroxylase-related dioxygenase (phytanoyl-CoA dioxygenase family)
MENDMSTLAAQAIEPTIELTPEQIAFFHENGYLAIESLTTPEEIEMLRGVYDRLFASNAGREEGNQYDLAGTDEDGKAPTLPQIMNPSRYAPEMANTLARANARRIAQQLLGSDNLHEGEHAIFKPARSGAATPWHQDEAYANPEKNYSSVSIWMPLQEATPLNGCMQFIPGSHKMEVVPHRSIGGDTRVHGLEVDPAADVDVSNPAICPLPAGGATIHGSRILHYTAPNMSDVPRRALIMSFDMPGTPRTDGRRFPWKEVRNTAREQRAKEARARQSQTASPEAPQTTM